MGRSKQSFGIEDVCDFADPNQPSKGWRVPFRLVTETPVFLKDDIDGPEIGDIYIVCRAIGWLGGKELFESGTGGVLFHHNAESGNFVHVTKPDVFQFTYHGGDFPPVGEIGRRLIAEWKRLDDLKRKIKESVVRVVDEAFEAFARERPSAKQMSPPSHPLAE